MKNCDEMINSLLERREQYAIGQKKKRITHILSLMCCVCLAVLIGFGVWRGNINTTGSTIENSMKVFNVISLSQGNSEEFAADMYRPEGFNYNIGSVLALKMSIVEKANYEFPVIVCIPDDINLEQVLNDANNILNKIISVDEASSVNISGEISTTDKYYYLLTAEQIIALADSGAKCYYVGSGKGDYKNMNWDTVEGVNAYCELHGDMYIANDNNVEHAPDIGIE